ncbi:MAG: inositol 2-dehydrogenase [Acidimicrobiales bacterium]
MGCSSLRVGVIGTGRIGRMHAGLLSSRVAGAELVAVSDAVPSVAEQAAQALGVPALSTPRLLANREVEAVAICAATGSHVPLIIQAAQAGKPIFCEKPISLDLAQVDEALAVVERAATPLMVGFNRRFDPSHAAVHEAVARGSTGEPHLVRITSRDPAPPPLAYARESGGIFLDMTIHDFDMARYVVGSEVAEVYAAGTVRVDPALGDLGDVDTAIVTLRHENKCLTVIDNSRQASYGYDQRVEVLGAQGLAASENPMANTSLIRDANGTRLATLPYFFLERYTSSYIRQWEAFVAAVRSGQVPLTSGRDGRAALVLGLAAKLSLREQRPVRPSEVDRGREH